MRRTVLYASPVPTDADLILSGGPTEGQTGGEAVRQLLDQTDPPLGTGRDIRQPKFGELDLPATWATSRVATRAVLLAPAES